MAGSFYGLRAQQVGYAPLDVSGYLGTALRGFDQAGQGLSKFGTSIQDRDDARFLTGLMQQKDYNTMKNWLANGEGAQLSSYASLATAKAAADHLQNQIATDTSADKLALEQEKDKFANYYQALRAKELLGDVTGVNAVQKAFANGAYGQSNYLGRLFQTADPNSEESKRAMAAESRARAAKAGREQKLLDATLKASMMTKGQQEQYIANKVKTNNGNLSGLPLDEQLAVSAMMRNLGYSDIAQPNDLQETYNLQKAKETNDSLATAQYAQKALNNILETNKQSADIANRNKNNLNQTVSVMDSQEDPFAPSIINTAQQVIPAVSYLDRAKAAGLTLDNNTLSNAGRMYDWMQSNLSDQAIANIKDPVQRRRAKSLKDELEKSDFYKFSKQLNFHNNVSWSNLSKLRPETLDNFTMNIEANIDANDKKARENFNKQDIPTELLGGIKEFDDIQSETNARNYVINNLPENLKKDESSNSMVIGMISDLKRKYPDASWQEITAATLKALAPSGFTTIKGPKDLFTGKRDLKDNASLSFKQDVASDILAKIRKSNESITNYKIQRAKDLKAKQYLAQILQNRGIFAGSKDTIDRLYYVRELYNVLNYLNDNVIR